MGSEMCIRDSGIRDSGVSRGRELESSATAGDSPVPETEKDAAGT